MPCDNIIVNKVMNEFYYQLHFREHIHHAKCTLLKPLYRVFVYLFKYISQLFYVVMQNHYWCILLFKIGKELNSLLYNSYHCDYNMIYWSYCVSRCIVWSVILLIQRLSRWSYIYRFITLAHYIAHLNEKLPEEPATQQSQSGTSNV